MSNPSNYPGGNILGINVADGDQLTLFDISSSGSARTKGMTVKETRRGLGLFNGNAQTWSSGALTITPGDFVNHHLEELTITLAAGTYTLTIADGDATKRFDFNRADLLFKLPGTLGLTINIRNSTGDALATVQDDGSGDDYLVELYYRAGKWRALRKTFPLDV